jgi:hypothetical protein
MGLWVDWEWLWRLDGEDIMETGICLAFLSLHSENEMSSLMRFKSRF